MIKTIHEQLIGDHVGYCRTYQLVASRLRDRGMLKVILKSIRTCNICKSLGLRRNVPRSFQPSDDFFQPSPNKSFGFDSGRGFLTISPENSPRDVTFGVMDRLYLSCYAPSWRGLQCPRCYYVAPLRNIVLLVDESSRMSTLSGRKLEDSGMRTVTRRISDTQDHTRTIIGRLVKPKLLVDERD